MATHDRQDRTCNAPDCENQTLSWTARYCCTACLNVAVDAAAAARSRSTPNDLVPPSELPAEELADIRERNEAAAQRVNHGLFGGDRE